ncbi:MAG: ATP-binding cassette domain-containing protein [Streptosporangiales bacterium]|nr:ATP-binding cassette domain-containing protein [Streptosporangiales bacterium]
MLALREVSTYYGAALALDRLYLDVHPGECVAVLGPNGAGKTTMAQTIAGLTPPRTGQVLFQDVDIAGWSPRRIARSGVALVPQGRRIFGSLTTEENLRVAVSSRQGTAWTLSDIYELFPRLYERRRQRGGTLSGGEQQMLALGRGLLTSPRLLILDEPTEGLAPVIIDGIVDVLSRLKADRVSLLIAEQRTEFALSLADTVAHVAPGGRITFHGSVASFRQLGAQGTTDELAAPDRSRGATSTTDAVTDEE